MKKLTAEQDKFLDMLATTHCVYLEEMLLTETDKWKIKMLKQQIKEDIEDYAEHVREDGW